MVGVTSSLVVTARGMACSNWTSWIPTDCIHSYATPSNPNGGVGVFSLLAASGAVGLIPKLSLAMQPYEAVDVNFAAQGSSGLATTYVVVNYTSSAYAAVDFAKETVELVAPPAGLSSLLFHPSWLEWSSDDNSRLLAWFREAQHGGPTVVVTETLAAIAGFPEAPNATLLYQNATSIPPGPGGTAPPAAFGHSRMIDRSGSVLWTASIGSRRLARWDVSSSAATPLVPRMYAIEGSTKGAAFDPVCLFLPEAKQKLPSTTTTIGALALAADGSSAELVSMACEHDTMLCRSTTLRKIAPWSNEFAVLRVDGTNNRSAPLCSVDSTTGELALLLGAEDPGETAPAFKLERVAVLAVQTRAATVGDSVSPIVFPFGDAGKAGRTWRSIDPTLSYHSDPVLKPIA